MFSTGHISGCRGPVGNFYQGQKFCVLHRLLSSKGPLARKLPTPKDGSISGAISDTMPSRCGYVASRVST
jgi:hypothetical protein